MEPQARSVTDLQAFTNRLWQARSEWLGARAGDVLQQLKGCLQGLPTEEQLYLRYILATLPPSDLTEYGPAFFQKLLRQALTAREEFSWCKALPPAFFLLHVAYPRIHNEELSDCRQIFHDALVPRIRGLSLPAAILAVNEWCAEQVTYRSTDARTASVLDVYQKGFGRCGEESAFTVTALRSVGIAARQVYCPWWSHCDDNHAWVECWDGEAWRYLGACEPEPELDRGWFTAAAGRAMLIESRIFLPEPHGAEAVLPGIEEQALYAQQGMVHMVQTARYAPTVPFTVRVQTAAGAPVAHARVQFCVLNMGAFLPLAEKTTGAAGTVCLLLGKGSIFIRCLCETGECAEALVDTAQNSCFTLTLPKHSGAGESAPAPQAPLWDFEFVPPAGRGRLPAPLSREKKQARRRRLEQAAALRETRKKPHPPALTDQQAQIFAVLPEKDQTSAVRAAVLQDAQAAFSFRDTVAEDIFQEGLLSPRIGKEPLFPWRKALTAALPAPQRKAFAARPEAIWQWIEQAFATVDSHASLVASPMATLRLKAGNTASLHVLFCALCRSVGVPARLSPVDEGPEFWRAGRYHPAPCGAGSARLQLTAQEKPVTLSRLAGQEPLLFTVAAGQTREVVLAPGVYRLITATRLPSGRQLARAQTVTLAAGEMRAATLAGRTADVHSLVTRHPLPAFTLDSALRGAVQSADLLRETALLCWLEPGAEPTEHLLNELTAAAGRIDCPVHFAVPEPAMARHPALCRALAALPRAQVWQGDFQDTAEELARSVFTEPGRLPLVLLCDAQGFCLYSCAGYNVGVAQLLAQLLPLLK